MRYPTASKEQLTAPKSQFRVIAVDVQDDFGTYVLGDFTSLDAASQIASSRAAVGNPVYIYNDAGEVLARLGSWH